MQFITYFDERRYSDRFSQNRIHTGSADLIPKKFNLCDSKSDPRTRIYLIRSNSGLISDFEAAASNRLKDSHEARDYAHSQKLGVILRQQVLKHFQSLIMR